ncbi:MAG: nitrile hydratase subunit alpha [Rhodospirillaceae bacterium]|nr:nitrile hydratase subunit alpha [Rhodospirillaceae bacterium]|tara:strand:+ start:1998 stop:2690 length:693 start_codon:yes stop_codon:yes gene_type:complete
MADEEEKHGHNHDHKGIDADAHALEHIHDHDRQFQADIEDNEPEHYELMTYAIKELLVEKGHLSVDEIRRAQEKLDSWQPSRGAKIVARAWFDPDYKQRLLKDGNEAMSDFGVDAGGAKLTVLENTEDVHNVVVCTLCSCYPRSVLGLPPDWYRSKSYRARVVIEPREVLKEFGTDIDDEVTVRVHDSLADLRYLVIPKRPKGTEGWSEDKLASIVTRDSMVGVVNPSVS